MKALLFGFALVSTAALAVPTPGAPVTHKMPCQSLDNIVGVGYSVEVTTQALAPEYSVRGISVVTRVVYPGAPEKHAALQQLKQDSDSATFADNSYKVTYDKDSDSASLYLNGKLEFVCHK